MTLRAANPFRGEVPLVEPTKLPENASASAVNARLYTGALTAFRQFAVTHGLANPGPVKTISLMAGTYWLSWDQQVDVARGTVPGDTTYRTYLTGLDAPRFTNLSLATTGPEPYPVTTRLLGVPPPDSPPTLVVGIDTTITSNTIDIYDDCSDLTSNWVLSPGQTGIGMAGSYFSSVTQSNSIGNPAPSFCLVAENNLGTPAYATRDFGTAGSNVITMSYDFNIVDIGPNSGGACVALFACGASGDGCRIYAHGNMDGGPPIIRITIGTSFASGNGSTLAFAVGTGPFQRHVWYTVQAQMVRNSDGTQTVTATLYVGSVQLCTVTTTNIFTVGGVMGPYHAKGDDYLQMYYDNFLVKATVPTGTVVTELATSYLYTFVNDLGEESAPSLPSATVLRDDNISVTITTPTGEPTGVSGDYYIQTKRIYRSVTGNTGTAFRFVAEILLSQPTYVDILDDNQLGDVLQSDTWALPPSDLQGILALPNGIMVGFSKNQLCFSAQNYPHAWPVEYRLTTDTNIVGIGNIDTTVVIGTGSFVYVASGNNPAAYSMNKFEVPHAASSKLSFAYVTGLGVLFAGPDGLMAVAGIGQLSNLTKTVFTRRQWQALGPASIFSVAHDDIYFMFWNNGSAKGCYAVDLRPSGFGIVEMAFHATCAYVDPVEDKLYLVLDQDNEPDNPLLPVPPELPAYMDSRTIYEFEGNPSVLMTYSWRTKLWLCTEPSFYSIAQVRAETYDNLVALFYGDGVLLDTIVIDGQVEFTLTPPDEAYNTFQMELIGTDTVRVLQASDEVSELG